MYNQCKIIGIFESIEQRNCDQARTIKKNGWFSDLELEANVSRWQTMILIMWKLGLYTIVRGDRGRGC